MCLRVFQGHHQVHLVRGGGLKAKPFVKPFGFIGEGVNYEGTDAGNICDLQGTPDGIGKKVSPQAFLSPIEVYGQATKNHDGNRVRHIAADPARGLRALHGTGCQRVIRNHVALVADHIGP